MADTDVYAEFRDAVNMTAGELKKWLGTDDSREVGQKASAGSESVGHDSGRKIIQILGKKKSDLTDADEQHMRKVVGYVHRHTAQRPDGDVSDTRWRRSLMNWGHDPLKR
jgi:DNA topoisomerase VI subunit B